MSKVTDLIKNALIERQTEKAPNRISDEEKHSIKKQNRKNVEICKHVHAELHVRGLIDEINHTFLKSRGVVKTTSGIKRVEHAEEIWDGGNDSHWEDRFDSVPHCTTTLEIKNGKGQLTVLKVVVYCNTIFIHVTGLSTKAAQPQCIPIVEGGVNTAEFEFKLVDVAVKMITELG